jgi:septum site-determining protein MinD
MLAIAGGKGGVGKTTTALGLSAAVDKRTLVADADVDSPNLHTLAGVDREPTLSAVDGDGVPAVAQPHPREPGVDLLPAPRFGADGVGRSLDRLKGTDGMVLVDAPGGAGRDAAAPLRAADATVVVSTACAPALRDATKTAAMARALDAPVVGAVLTRTRTAPEAAGALFGCSTVVAIPAADPPVLEDDRVRAAYARLGESIL